MQFNQRRQEDQMAKAMGFKPFKKPTMNKAGTQTKSQSGTRMPPAARAEKARVGKGKRGRTF